MNVFAIGDLHLSFSSQKPMDIFGPKWENHAQKIKTNWEKEVTANDIVLVCGDISWAMKPEEARADLDYLANLPGTKIIIKGNHDYWWPGITKLRSMLAENIFPLQNNYYPIKELDLAICGTRGWNVAAAERDGQNEKIYKRELIRMELSLSEAQKDGFNKIIVITHYPPFAEAIDNSQMVRLMLNYNVKHCYYGHIHGVDTVQGYEGYIDDIFFKLVSADHLGFIPYLISI